MTKSKSDCSFVARYIQEFVKENFTIVELGHHRPTSLIITDPETGEDYNVLSKSEYEGLKDKDREDAEKENRPIYLDQSYGEIVYPYGGFTKVILLDKNGNEFVGKYNFNKNRFVKNVGVIRAISLALRKTGALKGFNNYLKKVVEENIKKADTVGCF